MVVYANDTEGNMAASNTVFFTVHPGDINHDLDVNVLDLTELADAFFSDPTKPDTWNEAADLNCDDIIDVLDLTILADNFFKSYSE